MSFPQGHEAPRAADVDPHAVAKQPGRPGVAFAREFMCDARMDQFIAKHADKLQGSLSCFDRVLFRGYLPFFSGYAMASFLETQGVHRRDVKGFALTQAHRLKDHARQMAAREGRPCQHFGERTRKGDLARELAERDGITEGLVVRFRDGRTLPHGKSNVHPAAHAGEGRRGRVERVVSRRA